MGPFKNGIRIECQIIEIEIRKCTNKILLLDRICQKCTNISVTIVENYKVYNRLKTRTDTLKKFENFEVSVSGNVVFLGMARHLISCVLASRQKGAFGRQYISVDQ